MSVIIGITYNEWRNPVNEHAQVELALIQLIRQTSRTQTADGVFFYISTVRSDKGDRMCNLVPFQLRSCKGTL